MTRLTIMRGVPGSGKSTWAKSQAGNPVIVSRDSVRAALFGTADQDYYSVPKEVLSRREGLVTKIQDVAIGESLLSGVDVILDNTNIEWKFVRAAAEIAYKAGAEVVVKVIDVPLRTALAQNGLRAQTGGRNVPESVIRKMHDQFQSNKNMKLEVPRLPEPYNGTPGKPKAFMVDVDGTLAHMRDYRGPFDWAKVGLDDVDDVVADIVADLWGSGEYRVIVMSGRDGSCLDETMKWLDDNGIPWHYIYMREAGDMRKDSIVKAELFDMHVRDNFDVKFVLDDRNQVVDMWRSMGIKTLQVAEGDF